VGAGLSAREEDEVLEFDVTTERDRAPGESYGGGDDDDDDDDADDDYGSFMPFGQVWQPQRILRMLELRDRGQMFGRRYGPQQKIRHRHTFLVGIDNIVEGRSRWCKLCKQNIASPVSKRRETFAKTRKTVVCLFVV
jgi:hypothetical protein